VEEVLCVFAVSTRSWCVLFHHTWYLFGYLKFFVAVFLSVPFVVVFGVLSCSVLVVVLSSLTVSINASVWSLVVILRFFPWCSLPSGLVAMNPPLVLLLVFGSVSLFLVSLFCSPCISSVRFLLLAWLY